MHDYLIYFIFALILLGVALLYFRIADNYNIIDHPNERSSHSEVTLRGGGILFPIAALLFFVSFGFQYPYFLLGLVLIALISFLDDLLTLNNKIRLLIHFIAVILLFYQWDLFALPFYWLIAAAIFVIGTINAYNFMDGINGITGLYSLGTIATMIFLNSDSEFIDQNFLIITLISLLIFLYFNFRIKARCFAGDVGSISIAFIILFALGSLILQSQHVIYILFLAVYGTDTVLTIAVRLYNRENIFQPHRSHVYQLLSNESGFSQRLVAFLYTMLQIFLNGLIIWSADQSTQVKVIVTTLIVVILISSYFIIRNRIGEKINYLKV
ncbi:UDP-GlcNAc--UDP-phosphate GlcNAc-1-phosphate transferase [Daejeonella oryzae]|uniref:UDP-GlcNAc--UDP-phosphate GlcNAc-1-phosphate transferase n=1 Tax=Daejeonella oryzae TaxID=1122943 RepID=UPI0003F6AD1C|nr:UDP-GlcNAc--UDP-phosphate GlcNAc-1-phosphate transferase [Daejeonella oryzae]